MMLYEEESKVSTRWSAHRHVIYHVYVVELGETAQVPTPPNNQQLIQHGKGSKTAYIPWPVNSRLTVIDKN